MRCGTCIFLAVTSIVIFACGGGGESAPATATPRAPSSISAADASVRGTGDELLTEEGIQGSPLPNGETLRFGKVTAADGKRALAFQLAPGDPIQNGSHRSEMDRFYVGPRALTSGGFSQP